MLISSLFKHIKYPSVGCRISTPANSASTMLFSRTFLSVCFLACGLASPVTISGRNQPEGKVSWGPCDIANATLPIQCGTLGVPLDYTDSKSNETLNLQLLKVPAINGPSKGSILFNFGGPGLGARANLAGAAKILQTLDLSKYAPFLESTC